MQINIKSNVKQFNRYLTDIEKRQIPFATMGAINNTLFDVKKYIGETTYPRSFPERKNKSFGKRFPFRVAKASKRRLVGSVFDVAGLKWLSRQQSGGLKMPRRTAIAVPQTGRGRPRRTAKGYKPKPRELIANREKYFSGTPNGRGENKAGIYKRMGKGGRKKLLLMYAYEERAQVKPAFPFYRDAEIVTKKRFDQNFAVAMARAMRTAK